MDIAGGNELGDFRADIPLPKRPPPSARMPATPNAAVV